MANIKVKIDVNSAAIKAKIEGGTKAMKIAVTESVIEYGNIYVRVDQGVLAATAQINTNVSGGFSRANWDAEAQKIYASASGSEPEKGLAIWDTPYARKVYYTGTPSKDVNSQASLMWAEKGVKKHKKELQQVAQNAFTKGFGK